MSVIRRAIGPANVSPKLHRQDVRIVLASALNRRLGCRKDAQGLKKQ
jgi:hypothetical protein